MPVNNELALLSVIASARSGAIDRAWQLLRDAGLDHADDNPAALSVVGRLLKDQAQYFRGAEQKNLYRQSASAYRRAADLSGATYPLTNAATLSLLAGDGETARTLASDVLRLCESGHDREETPYYRLATVAEARLLLGLIEGAKDALREAMAIAPRAYEDHATTLRQFALILDHMAEDSSWLAPMRPPRTFHFAGHMGIAADDLDTVARVQSFLQDQRAGFGFGALAAGADIVIAETLIENGGELHVVLPAAPEAFARTSVIPVGEVWYHRFERLIQAADTVNVVDVRRFSSDSSSIRLATEVAMGRAVMHARMLCTEATQLVIVDQTEASNSGPGASQWAEGVWRASGRRQHRLVAPRRSQPEGQTIEAASGGKRTCIAAVLRIGCRGTDLLRFADEVLPLLEAIAKRMQRQIVSFRSVVDGLTIAFDDPLAAVLFMREFCTATKGCRGVFISGHYGVVDCLKDSFGTGPLLAGPGALLVNEITQSTPIGAIHLTEEFAAALHIRTGSEVARTEFVGELPELEGGQPIRLYSVRFQASD